LTPTIDNKEWVVLHAYTYNYGFKGVARGAARGKFPS